MKSWAEIQSSPEFVNAPDNVKSEVRGFYKQNLAKTPDFQALSAAEQVQVMNHIEGDKDFAIKMAAALIVGAKRQELDREMIDPEKENVLAAVLAGAKLAEGYLDAPLKDRPREPFADPIPNHLDKPLRALVAFAEDGTPEYTALKFWEIRGQMRLDDKIRDVLGASGQFPPSPFDTGTLFRTSEIIQDWPHARIPRMVPPAMMDQFIAKDPQAAIKTTLPLDKWVELDRRVMGNMMGFIGGLNGAVPHGFRPEVVAGIAREVIHNSYEIIARSLYQVPAAQGEIPIEPDHIAAIIMASDVLAPGMYKVADDFPSIFAIISGMAQVPQMAMSRFQNFVGSLRVPLTPASLLEIVNTGTVNFIEIYKVEQMLFQEACLQAGARAETLGRLADDARTACDKPLLSALTVKSEQLCEDEFKAKKDEIKQKIGVEVQRQLVMPALIPVPQEQEN